jgi:hypothetical protein
VHGSYAAAAAAVLLLHVVWLLWVIFGALLTRGRRALTALHLASLVWGIAVELGPWPCPLTALEQTLQQRAGITPYDDAFLVHYLDRLVYPDIPLPVLITGAVAVCVLNLGVYALRFCRTGALRPVISFSRRRLRARQPHGRLPQG